MSDTFLRLIIDDERNMLYDMGQEGDRMMNQDIVSRSSCLKMKNMHTVPEIGMATNHHDVNISGYTVSMNMVPKGSCPKYTRKPVKITPDTEKKMRYGNEKSEKRVRITFLNMVVTCTCWIYVQGTKPCGFHKPHRNKKHSPKARIKVQTGNEDHLGR